MHGASPLQTGSLCSHVHMGIAPVGHYPVFAAG